MKRICSPNTIHYLGLLPQRQRVDFYERYGQRLGIHGVDLLSRMLEFDPNDRITVENALAHPYLARYHNPATEPSVALFDFEFDRRCVTLPEIKSTALLEH